MADVIQFHCPACCIKLSIPLQAAGQRGPCPHCQQMILAPNPYTGVPACRLAEEQPPQQVHRASIPVLEPTAPRFEPFHGVPSAPPEPVYVPVPQKVEQSQPAAWPAALGIGVMAAILGFAGGYQSARPLERPIPVPASPTSTPPPAAAKEKDAFPVLTVPKSVLAEFLAAPDWKARSAFVLDPVKTTPLMERHHARHPDGPTSFTRTSVEHCEVDSLTSQMLVIFRVFTLECPTGFTVVLSETTDGWKVDWETFAEFKDDLFMDFVAGKSGDSGRFHLVVLPSTTPASREDKVAYILSDPVKGREFLANVQKGTETSRTLESITKDGAIATPVLELSRQVKPDGSYDLEILQVPSTNWRPRTK